ncbi:MAG: bifunctional (p)ppGpp synthetase/guanosine-3',5'-bis(diphosphate) 3'-pyrophosphohydrolase, partial [Lachnospiraceae bacterium]|nr:bifunctional (p)ppGpp synthetase/guanosine-3',5'-bis(diphosphate) 3'-pyrophosphohydrolase [Lachnospiraceae bacterium]
GDVKSLPNGSNPIDFAYSIHSAVGNKMIGARVNGRQVPIDYQIKNGDRIEIITSQNSKGPSRDWLNLVKSTQAKNKINQWFRQEFKEDNIIRGKELLASYCKSKGLNYSDYAKPEYMQKVMNKYGFKDWDSVFAAVGHGGLKEGQVMNKLLEEYEKENAKKITDSDVLQTAQAENDGGKKINKSKGGIMVKGVDDVAVRFSKCCSPVPGDEIVGFVTRGRGISIHRTDCINVLCMDEDDRNRLMDAEWQYQEKEDTGAMYTTEIKLFANNRSGVLVDISKTLTEMNIDVVSMNVRTNKQGKATISVSFDIRGTEQLNRIIAKLRNIEGIIDIERTQG